MQRRRWRLIGRGNIPTPEPVLVQVHARTMCLDAEVMHELIVSGQEEPRRYASRPRRKTKLGVEGQ
jgi:hypothetical protein